MSPRVAITPQGLSLNGEVRLLYGGEVQYYRLRDPEDDPARTHALWARTLDRLLDCGMNLVTTYVPWDYHEPRPGRFDFSGVRDLGRFFELCSERDLRVIAKPGPFINSEWPRGIGSFGAIPGWFLDEHPEALAKLPDGRPFTVDLLGRARGRQPSVFAKALRRACAAWFEQVAPILRAFVDDATIFALQLDNETNLYFASRYRTDHSVAGLKQYHRWLEARYGSLEALNTAYGSAHSAIDEVLPPTTPPRRKDEPRANRWHDDWFACAQAGFVRLHGDLRETWEDLGFQEPEILFLTNDSPHTFPGRELCLWDGRAKNQHGLACLDTYPRQLPTSGDVPADLPFLTSFFSKRFRASNDAYRFARSEPVKAGKCYGVELEGGLFEIPGTKRPLTVPESATDHVLLQHLGRGSALAVVYVFNAGRNLDGSPYFGNAAVDVEGNPGPRYEVLRRYGRLIACHGDALLQSHEVEAPVALILDGGLQAPAGGVATHPGKTQVDEGAAVFGWLEDAGLNPVVLDLRDGPLDLQRFRLAVFLDPGAVPVNTARALDAWTRAGGVLLHLLGEGRFDEHWASDTETEALLGRGLLAHGEAHSERRTTPRVAPFGNTIRLRVSGGPCGVLSARPFVRRYRVAEGAEVLAVDGWGRGLPVAWRAPAGAGTVVHMGTNPAALYGSARYFRAGRGEVSRARALARWIADLAGVRPTLDLEAAAGSAWARRDAQGGFLFAASRLRRAEVVRLRVHDPLTLGIEPGCAYALEEALSATPLGVLNGAEIARGLDLRLPAYGTAVVRYRRQH